MKKLLQQLKERRLELGFKQSDMKMRIGVSRQQYQQLESKGNPRLNTLELIAIGLNSEIMLIPKEKLKTVLVVLEGDKSESESNDSPHSNFSIGVSRSNTNEEDDLSADPWKGLLGDDS